MNILVAGGAGFLSEALKDVLSSSSNKKLCLIKK